MLRADGGANIVMTHLNIQDGTQRMANKPLVVDVSHYQPAPDWQALMNAGIVGVILKCTEGESYVDETFRGRYDAAIAAGLSVSTYHFMRYSTSIERQMNHYLNTLRPRHGERICLDHEDPKVSLQYLEDCVEYLLGDGRDLQLTIYSGHLIKDQLVGIRSDILADNTSLWLAQYGPTPTWPSGTWPTWALWQYTDQGKIAGISGYVDLNCFNGPEENCIAWIGPPSYAPEPTPEPEPELDTLTISINCPPGLNVRIVVNDEEVATGISN